MALSTSATSSPNTGSPLSIRLPKQNASNVDNLAIDRLSPPPSPTTARLRSDEQARDQFLIDFYDKIKEGAQDHLTAEQAGEIFTQALRMIEEHEGSSYLLARAFGTTNLATTSDHSDANPFSSQALELTLKAYLRKEEFFTNEKAKLTTLTLFSQLFDKLSCLFSTSSSSQATIQEKLIECQEELDRLQDLIPEIRETPPTSPRKVTQEPVDHWKTARLIFAFGFAAAIIAGAFVLGRRYITQLNLSE